MPEFNNLLEAEAWYKEEAQAAAEHREPNHDVVFVEPEVPANTVFDPAPELAYPIAPDPETIIESGSPYTAFEGTVDPIFDPAELTPIPLYNEGGTALVEPESEITESEITEATPVADTTEATPVADSISSDTPQE